MNKIKLLILLLIVPYFTSTAMVNVNKSPIEKVHHYLDDQFFSGVAFCEKQDAILTNNYYFFDDYCAVTSTSTANGISNFVTTGAITNISNASGPGSYSNYTSQVVSNFIGGTPTSFTITSVNGTYGMGIWIDWNNDFDFSDTGEQVYASGGYINPGSGTINIPAGTPTGSYRMRVVANWLSTAPTPCADLGNISYGEAEDYTFTVIAQPTCMPPSNLVLNGVTDATMTYSWTPGGTETSWEVIHQLNTAPAPAATATGTIVTTPTFTAQTLTPNTLYNVYVRAVCTDTDKSLWINLNDKRTSLVPLQMPWIENLEDAQSDLVFTEGTSVNKWYLGTATACEGTQSVYISNDGGTTNAYTISSGTTVHAYADVLIPAQNAAEGVLTFDYKVMGQGTATSQSDYLSVWLVPASYQPVAGTQITAANSGGIQLNQNLHSQSTCTSFTEIVNLLPFNGTVQRIVFQWTNNTFTGTQPPASIDNINFSVITCPRPIINEVVKNNAGQMVLSWTPTGTETAWELVIQPINSGVPTGASTIIPVVGTPQYLFTPTQGQIYEFYVRAKCSDTDVSLWQGPETFSDFNPPACAEIDVTPLELNLNEQGEYVICEGEDHVINLEAAFDPSKFKSTTSYEVESIDYAPPFPFLGGIVMPITSDDDYTASFDLPFSFCFFGNNYNFCRIGDNGVVTFGLPYTTTYGEFCPYTLNGPIPSTNFSIKNSIMGIFHDMHTTNNPGANTQINYQVLGTYPCRALVVNFNEVPTFGFSCTGEQYRTTTQIVLYEITNIIEVYVKDRNPCTGSTSNGQGVLGLINEDGSDAITPPNRNTGAWSATEEAWRFNPSGETNVTFGWYMDGELISTNPSHQVTINESHTFEARVTYPGCTGGEDLVLSKSFTVKVSEEIDLGEPDDVIFCSDNLEDEDRARITDNYDKIMHSIGSPDDFVVTYHKTQKEAEDGVGAIADPDNYIPGSYPETIFVRVESKETACFEIVSFDIIEGQKPLELKQEDIIICNKYALPALGEGQKYVYYNHVNFATGAATRVDNPMPGDMLGSGDYEVYVLSTSKDGCYQEFKFHIKVFPCIIPKGISPNGDGQNDNLDLADYMVQDIKIYNRYGKEVFTYGVGYTNQWGGQDQNGKLLPAGTYYYNIITPFEQFTGYIYLSREIK